MPLNRTLKQSPTTIKTCRFESLEDRCLMTGNVAAKVTSGLLLIRGDANANAVQVWQSGAHQWKVQGLGTSVNGTSSVKTFDGVDDITIALHGGNDFANVFSGKLSGSLLIVDDENGARIKSDDVIQVSNVTADGLEISSNQGNDNVLLNKVHVLGGDGGVSTFDGNDTLTVVNCTFPEFFSLETDLGADTIVLNGVQSAGSLRVFSDADANGHDSADTVSLNNVTAALFLSVATGDGNDIVSITHVNSPNLTLVLGSGNDIATIADSQARHLLNIAGNEGSDSITISRVDAHRAMSVKYAGRHK
jgi:hypothetical protein